jgi:hypothetical protein
MPKLSGAGLDGRADTVARPLLVDLMADVADVLAAAGIRCVFDLRDLNPPGTYLAPPTLHYRFGYGVQADWTLLVTAANTERARALTELGDLMVAVAAALGDRPVTATPAQVETSDQTAHLVAYEFTWSDKTNPQ